MQKFLTALALIPLSLILVVFSVANRHMVTVSYDPLDLKDPFGSIELPLYVVITASAILGVVAGGIATWLGQRRWRRAARRNKAEAVEANAQLANLRASIATPSSEGEPKRLLLGSAGKRDKRELAV
jgi:uncharacterized integral membrane protein